MRIPNLKKYSYNESTISTVWSDGGGSVVELGMDHRENATLAIYHPPGVI